MAKRRIGTLKGKPIVEGDSNLISKNEVNIKELGNTGGGNGSEFPGVWDSDYLCIGSEGNELTQEDRQTYQELVMVLANVASLGHAELYYWGNSKSITCSSFYPGSISAYVPNIQYFGENYQFRTGLLRISNASLGVLRQLYMQVKYGGDSLTVSELPKETFSVFTNLDIWEASSLLAKTLNELTNEAPLPVLSPEEAKNIILGVEGNYIIPAAEVEQFLIDIEKG